MEEGFGVVRDKVGNYGSNQEAPRLLGGPGLISNCRHSAVKTKNDIIIAQVHLKSRVCLCMMNCS